MKGAPGKGTPFASWRLFSMGSFYVALFPFKNKHFPMDVTDNKLPSYPFSCWTLSAVLWSRWVLLSPLYKWGNWGSERGSELLRTSTVWKMTSDSNQDLWLNYSDLIMINKTHSAQWSPVQKYPKSVTLLPQAPEPTGDTPGTSSALFALRP